MANIHSSVVGGSLRKGRCWEGIEVLRELGDPVA